MCRQIVQIEMGYSWYYLAVNNSKCGSGVWISFIGTILREYITEPSYYDYHLNATGVHACSLLFMAI